mmetsp:Transcript_12173/g.16818  ORF Transcript_12173/g.16818 Transcript_12173/m.16818 type:complete len:197 (-) Transcript_12173:98-688(-)|eukprot:CAMPEP_0168554780 /NCGR_PEP_ID=MMETSP0413-20121227/7968_1 /TAXON_ID=136452 /ORGANISM="Filamoeba nolandi, Strain NC-AS-23-1" /LENGTH=196 /DNA_ID=CAMNT_0008585555 /DNA_START=89 /DNA_END=679 /DNA_ORIENTATION=+
MFTARKKIVKEGGAQPTEFEDQVAQAIFDLEVNSQELKADLKDLNIVSAKEVEVSGGRKAVVIFVPFRQAKAFHKIQKPLIGELEKKFTGKHVVIIAQRRILRKPGKNNHIKAQRRPRNRTLTAVHEAILDDLVYPTEIVGKRLRYRLDGSKQMKVYLDRKDQANTEYKLETFASVYKKLTGKDTVFEFPVVQQTL